MRLIRDPSTGLGKGFGYVNFVSEESVAKAMRLNGRDVAGRKVRVNRAVRKPKSAEKHKEYKKLKESNRHLVATVKGLTGAFLVVGVSGIFTYTI